MENKKNEDIDFYHIGKVIKVLTNTNSKNFDKKTKAVVEMWDNNVITCTIGSAKVKDGNFVIVLIKGTVQGTNLFMHPISITDTMSEEAGELIWGKYKSILVDKTKSTHPFTG